MNNRYKNIHAIESSSSLSLLRCECGAEILILPDAKEMGIAIDAHATAHSLMEKDRQQAKVIAAHIKDQLIKQLFDRISVSEKTTKH